MNTPSSFGRALAFVAAFSVSAAVGAGAAPKPSPAAPSAVTHVRLWKTDLHAFPALHVSLLPEGRGATAHELGGGGPGYLFAEYVDLPAGRGKFEVFAEKDKKPLASLPVELKADGFATVLLGEPDKAGDAPRLELIDDGGSEPTAPAQVTVRNFVADLKDVRVTFGENLTARFAAGPGTLLMRGIAPMVYEARTSGASGKDEPFQWTNEVDFRQYHRQTLLIYPDPYGRIRPRISIDGEKSVAAPEKQDGQR